MAVSASSVFQRLAASQVLTIDRTEVASSAFANMRRSLRKIIITLQDAEDLVSMDVVDGLRPLFSEWLTVPTAFDGSMTEALKGLFGTPEEVGGRWGANVGAAYDLALQSADFLALTGNPLREALRAAVHDTTNRGQQLRIFCHRRAQAQFASLFPADSAAKLSDDVFLSSVVDYRDTEPFDVLFKVGPLRAHGWGAVPDAIITAPRFHTLMQFVWRGSRDEEDFGYDPVASSSQSPTSARSSWSQWSAHARVLGEDDEPAAQCDETELGDDLTFLRDVFRKRDYRKATLVQIDEKLSVLYPPRSQVLSFDPDAASTNPISHRVPGETLRPGMYLVRPNLAAVDLGATHAKGGTYSEVWKSRLKEEFRTDLTGLVRGLRNAGLHLSHLRSAIEYWCRAPTTVIHAPQQERHFEILIKVLRLDTAEVSAKSRIRLPWWQHAWFEIARSRGEAIHSGFVGREVVDEQVVALLNSLILPIRENALANAAFEIAIPPRSDISGSFLFHPIRGVEQGFHVPEQELKVLHDLRTVEKWRD